MARDAVTRREFIRVKAIGSMMKLFGYLDYTGRVFYNKNIFLQVTAVHQ
jgi:hypothetical protein